MMGTDGGARDQVTTNMARQTPADLAKQRGHEDCFRVLDAAMQREAAKQVPPHRTNLPKMARLHVHIIACCF